MTPTPAPRSRRCQCRRGSLLLRTTGLCAAPLLPCPLRSAQRPHSADGTRTPRCAVLLGTHQQRRPPCWWLCWPRASSGHPRLKRYRRDAAGPTALRVRPVDAASTKHRDGTLCWCRAAGVPHTIGTGGTDGTHPAQDVVTAHLAGRQVLPETSMAVLDPEQRVAYDVSEGRCHVNKPHQRSGAAALMTRSSSQ